MAGERFSRLFAVRTVALLLAASLATSAAQTTPTLCSVLDGVVDADCYQEDTALSTSPCLIATIDVVENDANWPAAVDFGMLFTACSDWRIPTPFAPLQQATGLFLGLIGMICP